MFFVARESKARTGPGLERLRLAPEVNYVDLGADRVTLRTSTLYGGPAFSMSTGRNCHSPTGKSRLIIPTPSMLAEEERQRRKQQEEVRRFKAFAEDFRLREGWIRAQRQERSVGLGIWAP